MGRNSRWPLVESALRIDIRELGRPSPGAPRGVFSSKICRRELRLAIRQELSWASSLISERPIPMCGCTITPTIWAHRADYVRTPEAIDETITLQRLPQPFGGYRWYFLCPTANRRCQVLYLPLGASRFRSRWGFRSPRLQYKSQRLSPPWRQKHRAERIARQVLNRGPAEFRQEFADYDFPPKPPGMRWRTYNRLDELAQAYDNAGEALLDERLIRWARRHGMNGVDDLYARALTKAE